MKKIALFLLIAAVVSFVFVSCGGDDSDKDGNMKVGMVTDAGTIDDKSFNQGTWEGILDAEKDLKVTAKYLKPGGTTEADYVNEIGNLYDAGYKMIVTPGFKFETAIYKVQKKYADAKFVLLDGVPHEGSYADIVIGKNTVSIAFAEHQSGFIAGIATALKVQDGEVGFIGGMEIPPVQKFNWGFQQGIKYANDKLGTSIMMKNENFVYQGTFSDVAAGKQIAAQMFDKGVKVVFCAAGGVGVGAINEAKSRAKAGEEVWIVGVDVNQYDDGLYDDTNSVILTSALKKVGQAAYDMIQAELNGKFPGGTTKTFDAKNDGVGLPSENPNLSAAIMKDVNKVFKDLQSGKIDVSSVQGMLFK